MRRKSDLPGMVSIPVPLRPFEFARDTVAFANELRWEYQMDPRTGGMRFRPRVPPPAYSHRCFVLVRAVRLFHYHAVFEGGRPLAGPVEYERRVRAVLRRDPRRPSTGARVVEVPGFAGLRDFSVAFELLLKALAGGAWRSYVLRSHWRMVFPISRRHQELTAQRLVAALARGDAPVLHLVRFPQLTINHGVLVFGRVAVADGFAFDVYDPNQPRGAVRLHYDAAARTFALPPTPYWAGGHVDVIEIFRGWLY